MTNCTVSSNVGPSAFLLSRSSSQASVSNSIFVDNNSDFDTLDTSTIHVQSTLSSNGSPFGNLNISDLGGNKFNVTRAQAFGGNGSTAPRLAPGALALNCGDNSALRVATDRAGRPRVAQGRVDLGAYELHC